MDKEKRLMLRVLAKLDKEPDHPLVLPQKRVATSPAVNKN